MSNSKPPTTHRLNLKAIVGLTILAVSLGAGALVLNLARPDQVRKTATKQIENLVENGRSDVALRHLDRYLQRYPDDEEMLFLQARLLSSGVSGVAQIEQVARMHDRLLRQFPENPKIDEVRARLAELYIRLSDEYRSGFDLLGAPEQGALESRYNAAAKLARELISRKGDDPRSHLLLGLAMERLAVAGAKDELNEAITSYERALALHERALRIDPEDEEAGEEAADVAVRLASLYRDRRDDEQAAMAVLDRLLASRPNSVQPRLARYRYYRESRDDEGARKELQAALEMAPGNAMVRMAAADHALQRGDPEAARVHVEAITEDGEEGEDPRRRLVNGMIDFAENQPDMAINEWREGLVLVYGTDAELAWWLAYVQIGLNRLGEAEQLIERYKNLSGGGETPGLFLLYALRDELNQNYVSAIKTLEDLRNDDRIDGRIRDQAILALGRCYQAVGNESSAERIYSLAAQADKRSIAPIQAQASLLLQDGRPEEATGVVERALEERPSGNQELLMLLVRCRLAVQLALPPERRNWSEFDRDAARVEEANRAGAEAEGVDPQSVELTIMLADREFQDGRTEAADDRLEKAIERWPNNPKIWASRAELKLRSGRPDESIAVLEEGLTATQNDPTLRLKLARDLVTLGRGQEAGRRLIEGIEQLPKNQQAVLWEALGRLRMAQADFAGASLAFRNSAQLDPSARADSGSARSRVDEPPN